MSLNKLNKTNSIYSKNVKRWHFQYNSYVGGDFYKAGHYLHQYYGEDQAPFDAYGKRLDNTPLDNHVKTVVDIYRSYLFRQTPNRTFGNQAGNMFVDRFMADADKDGQGINSFMKTAMDWAMVLGYVWIAVDRPSSQASSAAEEMEQDIRAYTTMYTPQVVTDWSFAKSDSGEKYLKYIKVIEHTDAETHKIKCWYPNYVEVYTATVDKLTGEYDGITDSDVMANNLGRVPFVMLQPQHAPNGAAPVSILNDVADMQKSIYNKLSELEQGIRMSTHPYLVKTDETKASGGAGGIINIPENMEPGLFPQLLEPGGSSIDSILQAIAADSASINAMTHLGAIRATKGSAMSGIAMTTERQLLNSKLSDLADVAQETEYKIWALWFEWMDITPDAEFKIEYYKTFDTRDPGYEMSLLQQSLITVQNEVYRQYAEMEIVKLTVKDENDLNIILESMRNSKPAPSTVADNIVNPPEDPTA